MLQTIYRKTISPKKFLQLKSPFELCQLLEVEYDKLYQLAGKPGYWNFGIPKKKGGWRVIEAPHGELKKVQSELCKYLQTAYLKVATPCCHGFISKGSSGKSRNIITNARLHVNKACVLNIDLKDYFHAISAKKVRAIFQSAPFNFDLELATCLALLCCYKKRLPMGAPTSPALSNFACLDLDADLLDFCQLNNMSYSRYADDLSFSADFNIEKELQGDILKVIIKHGFDVNPRKIYKRSKGQKQTVTGIVVNEKVNVDRRYLRKLRAVLFDWEQNGIAAAAKKHFKLNRQPDEDLIETFIRSIEGKLNHVVHVKGRANIGVRRMVARFQQLTHQ